MKMGYFFILKESSLLTYKYTINQASLKMAKLNWIPASLKNVYSLEMKALEQKINIVLKSSIK